MRTLDTQVLETVTGSVTTRFTELSDRLNTYLQRFREFGIRSNRAVAQYLCVDSAELSRLKNARVGDINLERAYEILRNCEELANRLRTFGGPLKVKDVYSVGFDVSSLPCVNEAEYGHAIALQQQSDSVLLTIDADAQRKELDMLLREVLRSVVHPKRNPYGPMSIMYVLKSLYAGTHATVDQLREALHVVQLGRRSCEKELFLSTFGEETRLRTLAVILNNGGGIALRLTKESSRFDRRMLLASKLLHKESLATYYFPGTMNGALTCANDLQDEPWAVELLSLFAEKTGLDRTRWPKGMLADLADPAEWQFLKANKFWLMLDGVCGEA
jgi:hypothetical protein